MSTIRLDQRLHLEAPAVQGRLLLSASALVLMLSGLFALYLGATGRFLPHDEQFLGMSARDLCALHGCRIVHFMLHDRVAFGGALVAVGALYLWLSAAPLRRGQAWAWWLFLLTGALGFGSFFAYLASGYLDTWHGVATLALLPCFLLGLLRSRAALSRPEGVHCLLRPSVRWRSAAGAGRACLLSAAAALTLAGAAILGVGMTCVFVPQDLSYMGLRVEELHALNPRLIPLIAHDRAGFGGALCCCGMAMFFSVWCGTPSRGLWRVLAVVGAVGFGAAIGVHAAIGYTDAIHLAPAVVAAIVYLAGMVLTYQPMNVAAPLGTRDRQRLAQTQPVPVGLAVWPGLSASEAPVWDTMRSAAAGCYPASGASLPLSPGHTATSIGCHGTTDSCAGLNHETRPHQLRLGAGRPRHRLRHSHDEGDRL